VHWDHPRDLSLLGAVDQGLSVKHTRAWHPGVRPHATSRPHLKDNHWEKKGSMKNDKKIWSLNLKVVMKRLVKNKNNGKKQKQWRLPHTKEPMAK